MNNDKIFVILRSVSGAGKTAFAEYLRWLNSGNPETDSSDFTTSICSADDYFIEKYGSYKWNAEELGAAHGWCYRKFESAIKSGINLIVLSNTNCKERDFKNYMDMAKENGYTVFSLIVENRHGGKDEHNVPEMSLIKQEDNLKNNLKLR